MKRAQSAMEFVILTGAIFFFFVAFIGLIFVSIEKRNFEKKDIALMVQAEYMADEISLAHKAGNGYQRTFTLPNTVLNKNYKIEIIESTSIYAYTNDQKHALSISCLKVEYDYLGDNKFTIDLDKEIIIENTQGVVEISQA